MSILSRGNKVILIGDSHISHGCNLKLLLSSNYEIYSIAKPGSNTSVLGNTAKEEISHLSHKDAIVICCGSNDYDFNNFSATVQNITNFVQANKYTNIILLNVPHRYDLSNAPPVNNTISILNRKLMEMVMISPHTSFLETDNNRRAFTNHGLHLNKSSKCIVTYQLASHIQAIFKQSVTAPITFEHLSEIQAKNLTICDRNHEKVPIRNSSRTKKLPSTRSDDFLWPV